jgi:hypothetical protein
VADEGLRDRMKEMMVRRLAMPSVDTQNRQLVDTSKPTIN